MQSTRRTAVAAGMLFITATATSLLCTALTHATTNAPHYLSQAAAHADRLIAGALLLVAAALSVAAIPAVLFPVLRRCHEGIALSYLGVRVLEAVTQIVYAIAMLLLVTLGRAAVGRGDAASSGFRASGALLQGALHWAFLLDPTVFGVGALMFYVLLYRARLVPRWLSGWGFVGGALVLAYGLAAMFGRGSMLWALPIGVQEMVLAGWLIAKGFAQPGTVSKSLSGGRVATVGQLG